MATKPPTSTSVIYHSFGDFWWTPVLHLVGLNQEGCVEVVHERSGRSWGGNHAKIRGDPRILSRFIKVDSSPAIPFSDKRVNLNILNWWWNPGLVSGCPKTSGSQKSVTSTLPFSSWRNWVCLTILGSSGSHSKLTMAIVWGLNSILSRFRIPMN